jgi:hypothetical protein
MITALFTLGLIALTKPRRIRLTIDGGFIVVLVASDAALIWWLVR